MRLRFEVFWVNLLPMQWLVQLLPVQPVRQYRQCWSVLQAFKQKLLAHVVHLSQRGQLRPNSFAASLLKLQEGNAHVLDADLCEEIYVMFVAGAVGRHVT